MIKGVIQAHLEPIWYHSEPSDVPYSPNQFLGLDFFLPVFTSRRLLLLQIEIGYIFGQMWEF